MKYYFLFFLFFSLHFQYLPPLQPPPPLPRSFSGNHANQKNCFFFWLLCFLDLLPHSFSEKIHPRLISEEIHTKTPKENKKKLHFFLPNFSRSVVASCSCVFKCRCTTPLSGIRFSGTMQTKKIAFFLLPCFQLHRCRPLLPLLPLAFVFRDGCKPKKLLLPFFAPVFSGSATVVPPPSHSFSAAAPPHPRLLSEKILAKPPRKTKKIVVFLLPMFFGSWICRAPPREKKKIPVGRPLTPRERKFFFRWEALRVISEIKIQNHIFIIWKPIHNFPLYKYDLSLNLN